MSAKCLEIKGSWILLLLLVSSCVCLCLLCQHARVNSGQIAALRQRVVELRPVGSDGLARKTSSEIEELENLRKEGAEVLRLRSEVAQLYAELEKRKLAAT